MEKALSLETKNNAVESNQEALAEATRLLEELKGYEGKTIVGQAETEEVEALARSLTEAKKSLTVAEKKSLGLYHPHDELLAA